MSERPALIVVMLDKPDSHESEWNAWYDTKHIPNRLAIPGFLNSRRFAKIESTAVGFSNSREPKYLTLYDLETTDVLRAQAYLELKQNETAKASDSFESITLRLPKFARGVYNQVYPPTGSYKPPNTNYIFVVGHEVPENRIEEFNAWYDTEHIPAMFRVPGFVTARRFVMASSEYPPILGKEGFLPLYLTIYDIENVELFQSEDFLRERESPWSTWVRSWFSRKIRAIYYRIYPND
jgi:hypothetical protein